MKSSAEDEVYRRAEATLAPVVAVMMETTRKRIAALPPGQRTSLLAQAYALFVLRDLAKARREIGNPVAEWLDGKHITEAFAGIELLAKHGRLAPAELLMPDPLRDAFRRVVHEVRTVAVMGRFRREQASQAGSNANAMKVRNKVTSRNAIMREACSGLPVGASDKDRMNEARKALHARWLEWYPAFSGKPPELSKDGNPKKPPDADLDGAMPDLGQFRAIVGKKPPR